MRQSLSDEVLKLLAAPDVSVKLDTIELHYPEFHCSLNKHIGIENKQIMKCCCKKNVWI